MGATAGNLAIGDLNDAVLEQLYYGKALAAWEEAQALNPEDRILDTNIRMLRKKLKLS